MDVIYRAFDGKEFCGTNAYEECVLYEEKLRGGFVAFNELGISNNVATSLVILIRNEEGLKSYLALCEYEGISSGGIDAAGLWIWNESYKEFIYVENSSFEALNRFYTTERR